MEGFIMKKKFVAILLCMVMITGMATACTTSSETEKSETTTSEETGSKDYAPVDFDSNDVFGVSPDGEAAGSIADVQLTEEEKEEIRNGNYTVAFCYHQLDNQVNQSKLEATKAVLEDLNMKVLSVTDAQSDPDKLVNDLETTLAMKPDVLISMPYDPDVTAATYRKFVEAGTKIVFLENVATGFEHGTDYATMTNSDSYGNGKYAADILAREIGYSGKVAMVYYDADFFTTNERDRAFRETMANYPDIEIVDEFGFTSIDVVGASADAMFAKYPDIDGVYASWDIPAEDVMASAQAVGHDDLVITTVDLGDNAATLIAKNGMIKGLGCPRAVETGTIEGLAAGCAVIGKELPSYIVSASQAVARDNILDAYKICYNIDPPKAVTDAYNSVK